VPPIVLYDGTCGLCSKSVQWILRHEADHTLVFAPLQGKTAAELRARHPEIPETLDSVVLVDEADRVWLRSKTFLRVAKHLRAPWRIGWHARWFPAFVLDLGYRVIARLRYRIWGRADICDIPAPEARERFLP
jgi:predicted DCC family thiol-disulfide oxidoreductase YuxK